MRTTMLLLAGALALAGCSAPMQDAETPDAPTASGQVRAIDDAFEPAQLEVLVGATVTWTNEGQAPHSVTMPALALDEIIAPGASVNASFPAPGRYAYRCLFHPGMTGNVTVGGDAAPAAPPNATNATPPSPPPAPGGVVANVTIVDDAFSPASVTVPVGGRVQWTNRGEGHSVTFSALPIDRVFRAGESFGATFDAVGTYAYVCKFHDDMRGSVSVVAPGDAPEAAPQLGGPGIFLDRGHYDDRPIDIRNGTPVLFNNPRDEDVAVEFRDGQPPVHVPPGGSVAVYLPVGEHWWREADDAGDEWDAEDHDVGVIRVAP